MIAPQRRTILRQAIMLPSTGTMSMDSRVPVNMAIQSSLETRVLFLMFNCPDVTRTTLAGIRKARPAGLFVGSDGPRFQADGETRKAEDTRDATLAAIDWDCDVNAIFRTKNLECKRAVNGLSLGSVRMLTRESSSRTTGSLTSRSSPSVGSSSPAIETINVS